MACLPLFYPFARFRACLRIIDCRRRMLDETKRGDAFTARDGAKRRRAHEQAVLWRSYHFDFVAIHVVDSAEHLIFGNGLTELNFSDQQSAMGSANAEEIAHQVSLLRGNAFAGNHAE